MPQAGTIVAICALIVSIASLFASIYFSWCARSQQTWGRVIGDDASYDSLRQPGSTVSGEGVFGPSPVGRQ